ncbi:hypothetical protein D3C85_1722530 [compost metagenome]
MAMRSRISSSEGDTWVISERSPPAQKCPPAPVRTIARVSGSSSSNRWNTLISARRIFSEKALRHCG